MINDDTRGTTGHLYNDIIRPVFKSQIYEFPLRGIYSIHCITFFFNFLQSYTYVRYLKSTNIKSSVLYFLFKLFMICLEILVPLERHFQYVKPICCRIFYYIYLSKSEYKPFFLNLSFRGDNGLEFHVNDIIRMKNLLIFVSLGWDLTYAQHLAYTQRSYQFV